MSKIIIYALFFSFVFLFGGCSSAKRVVVAQKPLPQWYENPPHSKGDVLYGVGEGKNKQEAINNALSFIASTLSVSISSSFRAKTVIREGSINSSDAQYVNQTHSRVKRVRITNYTLVNAAELGFKHYAVLVAVSKQKLFAGLQSEVTQTFLEIAIEEKGVQRKNTLAQFVFYEKALQKVEKLQNDIVIMKVLQPNYMPQEYYTKREALVKKYNALRLHIHFSIHATKEAKRFVSSFKKGIEKRGFFLGTKEDKYHFIIKIEAQIVPANAYGFTIARAQINVTTYDKNKNIIGANLLHITGQSSQGYSVALQDLSKKLGLQIEKEGIFKILNLNIY